MCQAVLGGGLGEVEQHMSLRPEHRPALKGSDVSGNGPVRLPVSGGGSVEVPGFLLAALKPHQLQALRFLWQRCDVDTYCCPDCRQLDHTSM